MIYAENRGSNTQYELGQMFSRLEPHERDYQQAAIWFRRSAKKGNTHAQYKLGIMYSRGLGVKLDYLRAYAWLKIAATQGSGKALHVLRKLAKKIPPRRQRAAHRLSRSYYEHYVAPFNHIH